MAVRTTPAQSLAQAHRTLTRAKTVNQRLDRLRRFEEEQGEKEFRSTMTAALADMAREGRITEAEIRPLVEALLSMSDQDAANLLNALKARPQSKPSPAREQA